MSKTKCFDESLHRAFSQAVSRTPESSGSVFRIQRKIKNGDWEDFALRTPITIAEQACKLANDYNDRTPDDVIFRPVEIIIIVTELKPNIVIDINPPAPDA